MTGADQKTPHKNSEKYQAITMWSLWEKWRGKME